jgi:carbon-monoxide dehydrogenase small subunit
VSVEPAERVEIGVVVNGETRTLSVAPSRMLVHTLREDLGLTGTKEACSIGVCGVCSVLVDGAVMSACLVPTVRLDGRSVTTVEGLAAADGSLSPVQAAFIEHGGLQCGICTPGQVVAATALLAENPTPDEDAVREFMTGNLCRCTGYYGIVASVLAAAGAGEPFTLRPELVELPPVDGGGDASDGHHAAETAHP